MTETPKLRPGAMPRQDLGWLTWTPVHPRADVVEDLAVHAGRHDDDVRRHADLHAASYRPSPKIRFEDRDGPLWIRIAHDANASWSVAGIAKELGLADVLWYVRLVLTQSCRRHRTHA